MILQIYTEAHTLISYKCRYTYSTYYDKALSKKSGNHHGNLPSILNLRVPEFVILFNLLAFRLHALISFYLSIALLLL